VKIRPKVLRGSAPVVEPKKADVVPEKAATLVLEKSELAAFADDPTDQRPVGHDKHQGLSPLNLRLTGGKLDELPSAHEIHATSYRLRLKTVEKLGRRFPGTADAAKGADTLEQIGVWAGIHMQTNWQKRSGRAASAFWSVLNYSLSKLPEKYMDEYTSGQMKPPDGSPESEVRQAWYAFFQASDEAQSVELRPHNAFEWLTLHNDRPQQALWDAHCKSLHFAEHQWGEHLEKSPDPKKEAQLSQAWLGFVDHLGTANFPTTKKFAKPILERTMPDKLLKPGAYSKLGLTKRVFVTVMTTLRGLL
jgi:hypothetical protein